MLRVREADGSERVLLDPMALDPAGTTTLDAWSPSWEGDRLAYQVSTGGDEESRLHVLDVATGEVHRRPGRPVPLLPRRLAARRRGAVLRAPPRPGGRARRRGAVPPPRVAPPRRRRRPTPTCWCTARAATRRPTSACTPAATAAGWSSPARPAPRPGTTSGSPTSTGDGAAAGVPGRRGRPDRRLGRPRRPALADVGPRHPALAARRRRPGGPGHLGARGVAGRRSRSSRTPSSPTSRWSTRRTARCRCSPCTPWTPRPGSRCGPRDGSGPDRRGRRAGRRQRLRRQLPARGRQRGLGRLHRLRHPAVGAALGRRLARRRSSSWEQAAVAGDVPELTVVETHATSEDGTPVHLFVLSGSGTPDTPRPAVLYGYGGFNVSLTPAYTRAGAVLGGRRRRVGGGQPARRLRARRGVAPGRHAGAQAERVRRLRRRRGAPRRAGLDDARAARASWAARTAACSSARR